jgi:hypothetical protein
VTSRSTRDGAGGDVVCRPPKCSRENIALSETLGRIRLRVTSFNSSLVTFGVFRCNGDDDYWNVR